MVFPEDLKIRFKALVNERAGLYFKDYATKDLDNAILQRMKAKNIDSPLSYYNLLVMSEEKENEFRELLNILTITHTYFFRNEPQFKVLKERVLPEIINRSSQPVIRIWSAGCSTGEEPYSIAIILREIIPDIENWNIQIIASDASQSALDAAKKGRYSETAIKHVPEEYLSKYFEEIKSPARNRLYAIKDSIKRMITFAYFNLMEKDYPVGFDIIFCRNVVIYFELPTTVEVISKMYTSLIDNGYLFIGYSESLQFICDKFRMIAEDEAIYYRKSIAAEEKVYGVTAPEKEKITPLLSKKLEDILVEAVKLSHMKDYAKALKLIDEAHLLDKKALDPYYLAAEILFNQGKLDEAQKKLDSVLKVSPLFAPAHYLLGCVYLEKDTFDYAKESFRKALFIDKHFLLAHFYIAQAYKNEGRTSDAIREYRNASKILSNQPPQDIIPYSGGFNTATILSICRDNLERLKAYT